MAPKIISQPKLSYKVIITLVCCVVAIGGYVACLYIVPKFIK